MENSSLNLLLIGAFLSGCSMAQQSFERLQRNMREPGEIIIANASDVWIGNRCMERKLPYVQLDKTEIVPTRLKAGESLNHRFIYSLCQSEVGPDTIGTLRTKILFRNSVMVSESVPSYMLKPGKWIVDAMIDVPRDADPGFYTVELSFRSRNASFKGQSDFIIEQ